MRQILIPPKISISGLNMYIFGTAVYNVCSLYIQTLNLSAATINIDIHILYSVLPVSKCVLPVAIF
jgi:hypothetical protein